MNNNALKIIVKNKNCYLDSREVANMIKRPHNDLLKSIKTYIEYLTEGGISLSEYFKKSSYSDTTGRKLPCYLCTKKGCDMIALKLRGKDGVLFAANYIEAFYAKEKLLREKQTDEYKSIRAESKEVTKNVMKQLKDGIKDIKLADYRKANTIADKATSIRFGLKKMIKVAQMTGEMLEFRNKVIDKVKSLMVAQAMGVPIEHISDVVYADVRQLISLPQDD